MHDLDVQKCIELAKAIVLRRRQKQRRDKSRKETSRSWKSYQQRRFPKDIVGVLRNALNKSKSVLATRGQMAAESSEERFAVVALALELLRRDLRNECRQVGRPRKTKGMIASAMRSEPRPNTEREWAHTLWGAALVLWADQECLPRTASIDDVVDTLTREPGWRGELEMLIPKTIRLPAMQEFNPPAKNQKAGALKNQVQHL